jgi:hypothetical protein
MSALDQAKTHSKHGYKVITQSLAAKLTPEEFARLYPAQRGFVNRARRQAGLGPFPKPDMAAAGMVIEAKTKPVVEQLEQAVELEREVADDPVPKPKAKPAKSKRKGIFGATQQEQGNDGRHGWSPSGLK